MCNIFRRELYLFVTQTSTEDTKLALQMRISELFNFYQPIDLKEDDLTKKKIALQKLTKILKVQRELLQESDFEEVLFCSLSLLFYFGLKPQIKKSLLSYYWRWRQKILFLRAEAAFKRTFEMLLPERSETTVKIVLQFFGEVKLWPAESCVVAILENFLLFQKEGTILFNMMLTDLHCELSTDIGMARNRMRALYELLKSDNWVVASDNLLPFVTRLLNFFQYCLEIEDKEEAYAYLRKGFEVCLRKVFEKVQNPQRLLIIRTILSWFTFVNIRDAYLMHFSSLLLYAAELYEIGPYMESLTDDLVDHILTDLVGSNSHVYNFIGLRLLVRLFDRHHNAPYLTIPTLYYEFSQVHLKVGENSTSDKEFIRKHRQKLHEHILNVVTLHGWCTGNLKAMYSVICCIVLEVPCGFTAAAAACMTMAIQDFALNSKYISVTCRYWMHAIVVSTMSLICWAHKAPVLYRYVNQIISRRMKEAPQLNPPMKKTYEIRHSHVTWNKPTLFFEDWELRYGLWKQFQVKPKNRITRAKYNLEKNRKVSKIKSSKNKILNPKNKLR